MIQLSSTEGHWQSSPEILEEILKEPEMDSAGYGGSWVYKGQGLERNCID